MILEADGTTRTAFGPLKVQTVYLAGSPGVIAEIMSWSQRSGLTLAEVLKLPRGTKVFLIRDKVEAPKKVADIHQDTELGFPGRAI